MKRLLVTFGLIALVAIGFLVALAFQQASVHRRYMTTAVTNQLDAHTQQIAVLLATMRGSDVSSIEDAAHKELQAVPSTSLISRSMIRVARAADGSLECIIDTSSLGVAPRTIQPSRPAIPK